MSDKEIQDIVMTANLTPRRCCSERTDDQEPHRRFDRARRQLIEPLQAELRACHG
jgi:hypothetical protein